MSGKRSNIVLFVTVIVVYIDLPSTYFILSISLCILILLLSLPLLENAHNSFVGYLIKFSRYSQTRLALNSDLVIFCWGDENADQATIKFLKSLGLHGVIYDKIHEYSGKEVKESIFLVEARESQKELLRMVAASAESPQSPPPQPLIKVRR